jgi:RP/EB family microtubule-associated protein
LWNLDTDSKIQELTAQIAELKLTVESLQKEKDFYFNKLREIDIWTQRVDPSLQTAAIEIQKILYPLSLSLVSRDSM